MAASAAVIGAVATVYSASQAGKSSGPKMPKAPVLPKLPETRTLTGASQQADILARNAGGSILSNQRQNQNQVADGSNAVRKTLLGT
ncbi:MAG: hypothetical protein V4636_12930 [Pseudomonadota bacterium]